MGNRPQKIHPWLLEKLIEPPSFDLKKERQDAMLGIPPKDIYIRAACNSVVDEYRSQLKREVNTFRGKLNDLLFKDGIPVEISIWEKAKRKFLGMIGRKPSPMTIQIEKEPGEMVVIDLHNLIHRKNPEDAAKYLELASEIYQGIAKSFYLLPKKN